MKKIEIFFQCVHHSEATTRTPHHDPQRFVEEDQRLPNHHRGQKVPEESVHV